MAKNVPQILSLSAALAALSGVAAFGPTPAVASVPATDQAGSVQKDQTAKAEPNILFPLGKDLLGLTVTTAADGTMLAQHYSHYSHASHSSHYSHYSGR
jgi:hypothetical protein